MDNLFIYLIDLKYPKHIANTFVQTGYILASFAMRDECLYQYIIRINEIEFVSTQASFVMYLCDYDDLQVSYSRYSISRSYRSAACTCSSIHTGRLDMPSINSHPLTLFAYCIPVSCVLSTSGYCILLI